MALLRDTKARAKRIDLTYFRKAGTFRRWTRILSILLPVAGLSWVVAMAARGDERLYNSGTISTRHAMLENKCDACHTTSWAQRYTNPELWQERLDQACLACHDAPIHHGNSIGLTRTKDGRSTASRCSQCHLEHQGTSRLAQVKDRTCTQCHSDLQTTGPEPHPKSCPAGADHAIFRKIDSFEKGHPEFALLSKKAKDPTVMDFNHAVHLTPDTEARRTKFQEDLKALTGRRGIETHKDGLRLGCGYCHTAVSPGDMMAPLSYEQHCRSCHPVEIAKEKKPEPGREYAGAKKDPLPHVAPQPLRDFLRSRFAFQGATGDELMIKVKEAEGTIYSDDPSRCMKCHKGDVPPEPEALPVLKRTGVRNETPGRENAPRRWFAHSIFNHETHRELRCAECHAGVDVSKQTSDLLMPGLSVCLKCHSTPGAVSFACVTCHKFHDRTGTPAGEGRLQIRDVVK